MGSLTTTGVVKGSLDFRQVIEFFFAFNSNHKLIKGGVEALNRPRGMFRFNNMTVVWIFLVNDAPTSAPQSWGWKMSWCGIIEISRYA